MQMLDKIRADGGDSFSEGAQVAMLVNNLGSTPLMETYIMAQAALKHAQDNLKVCFRLPFVTVTVVWHTSRQLRCQALADHAFNPSKLLRLFSMQMTQPHKSCISWLAACTTISHCFLLYPIVD